MNRDDEPILHEVPCRHCNGKGKVLRLNGRKLAAVREQKEISLRDMAKRLGISAAYLSDVENDRRQGNADIRREYLKLCAT